jgi:hypothetical protein
VRRVATIVLGLAYLLQASWLLQGGADLLFPRTQVVKAGAATCCNSGCGCPEEAKERKSCCCFPQKETSETRKAVPVSSFEEERCRGGGGAGTDLVSLPALAGPTMPLPIPSISIVFEAPTPAPVQSPPSEPPDKVPL